MLPLIHCYPPFFLFLFLFLFFFFLLLSVLLFTGAHRTLNSPFLVTILCTQIKEERKGGRVFFFLELELPVYAHRKAA
jgi:hypothetical protein